MGDLALSNFPNLTLVTVLLTREGVANASAGSRRVRTAFNFPLDFCYCFVLPVTEQDVDKMDDHPDPILNFFTQDEADASPPILYTTLSLDPTATVEQVRKAYRRLALKYHPDKHAGKSEAERKDTEATFQRVGFAYAVLSDETKRKRYV